MVGKLYKSRCRPWRRVRGQQGIGLPVIQPKGHFDSLTAAYPHVNWVADGRSVILETRAR